MIHIPNAAWDWNIYLHEWLKFMGKLLGIYIIHIYIYIYIFQSHSVHHSSAVYLFICHIYTSGIKYINIPVKYIYNIYRYEPLITCRDAAPPTNSNFSTGKVACFWKNIINIYQPIPPMYGLCNGCTGQYGVIFWEQLRPGTLQEI